MSMNLVNLLGIENSSSYIKTGINLFSNRSLARSKS